MDKRYFTIIPNLVDDYGLPPRAFRLYCHYKRVAGEDGVCFESNQTIADVCCMHVDTVSLARQELIDAGLVTDVKKYIYGKAIHHTRIMDVWTQNMQKYSPFPESEPENGAENSDIRKISIGGAENFVEPVENSDIRKISIGGAENFVEPMENFVEPMENFHTINNQYQEQLTRTNNNNVVGSLRSPTAAAGERDGNSAFLENPSLKDEGLGIESEVVSGDTGFPGNAEPFEKKLLGAFGRRRGLNRVQRGIVQRIEAGYPEKVLDEWLKWGCAKGLALGDMLASAEKTLAKWGKAKRNGGNSGKKSAEPEFSWGKSIEYSPDVLKNDPLLAAIGGE